jgi:predicted RNase H-like HicB family nuclease
VKSALKVRYELDETGWWVASIDAVPGCHTQGRTIEQARERIREALAALVGDKAAARAELQDDIQLPPKAKRAVINSYSKRDEASKLALEAELAAREAARTLSKSMSLRDVGAVLGVSRQRAHQLIAEPLRKAVPAGKTKELFNIGGYASSKTTKPQKSARGQKTAS